MRKKYKKDFKRPASIIAKKVARILLTGAFFAFLLGSIFSGFPILAFIWNTASPSTSTKLAQVLAMPINANSIEERKENNNYEFPEKNSSFSLEPQITIKKIEVNTQIIEKPLEKYEEALRQGVWRVPDFGTPMDRKKPIILVAHRFGYVNWNQSFREKNSFYDLPRLEIGDQVEIIWDQRKFVYEIYQKEEGEDISHYSADLILYTCRFWESDIRIFRYARLIST